jgi:hypothetical protein
LVKRGDYARILAEFWADGPESETPPGHWFTIFNYVSDHPLCTKQYKGVGPVMEDVEWSVKGYLALGGAMHDVAVTVWGMKGWYDSSRPLSAIRRMAEYGQSTNPADSNYHPAGLPLVPGYIEVIHPGDPLAAGGANVGKIKLYAWKGHAGINNVDTDEAGVDWILAEDWLPYQRPSFVTPPFAGYVSGHSTYSRAAAEVLTDFTGDKYFPGGLGVFHAPQDEFLVFEDGPSTDIDLQWATYQDAADESSLSRIWGGIHPPFDDIPGRKMAVVIAEDAFTKAELYFNNIPGDSLFDVPGCLDPLACNYSSLATQDNGSCSYGQTWYADADGDGYGSSVIDTVSCIAVSGFVTNDGDCNDALSAIHPLATEVCANSIDDNCNNISDEGCGTGIIGVKVIIEGFHQGGGWLSTPLYDNGLHANPDASDSLLIELHQAVTPYALVSAQYALLQRNGYAVRGNYPAPGNYFIVVKPRNGIETWSKVPVNFTGATVFFDFSKP